MHSYLKSLIMVFLLVFAGFNSFAESKNFILKTAQRGNPKYQARLASYYLTGENGFFKDYAKALEWAKKSSDKQNGNAFFILYKIYNDGIGVVQDKAKAKDFYQKALDLESDLAFKHKGDSYYKRKSPDYDEAFKWYEKSAKLNNAEACFAVAKMYINEEIMDGYIGAEEGEDSETVGIEWAQKAAKLGNVEALYFTGISFIDATHGVEDETLGFIYIKQAALQGHTKAMLKLADFYEQGRFTPRNKEKAFEWYVKAAEHGYVKAQHQLGKLYLERGNYKKAFDWYLKAANKGHGYSQYNVSLLYQQGIPGVMPPNPSISFQWSMKAARNGIPEAQCDVALAYKTGMFVRKNPTESAKWLLKAAKQGNKKAAYGLAFLFAKGEGVEQDYLLAYSLLLAHKPQDRMAKKLKKFLENSLSEAEERQAKSYGLKLLDEAEF